MPEPVRESIRLPEALALGVIGGVLLARGGRSSRGRILSALLGLAIVGRAAQPIARRWVLRRGSARRRLRLKTELEVRRPVPEVFAFCKDFENFPKIIGSLRGVVDYQDGRSHWEGYTPSGEIVSWDAIVTKYVPNTVIGWSSVPKSEVDATGVIRFAASESGGTLLTVELSYTPRHTGLSDAIHALAAPSSQQQIRADLDRASFYVESLPALVEEEPSEAKEVEA